MEKRLGLNPCTRLETTPLSFPEERGVVSSLVLDLLLLDLLGTKIKMEELNQRMIIVGDSGVGKTSFIIRWEREYFSEDGLRP